MPTISSSVGSSVTCFVMAWPLTRVARAAARLLTRTESPTTSRTAWRSETLGSSSRTWKCGSRPIVTWGVAKTSDPPKSRAPKMNTSMANRVSLMVGRGATTACSVVRYRKLSGTLMMLLNSLGDRWKR